VQKRPKESTWPKISVLRYIPVINLALTYQSDKASPLNNKTIAGVSGKTVSGLHVKQRYVGERILGDSKHGPILPSLVTNNGSSLA